MMVRLVTGIATACVLVSVGGCIGDKVIVPIRLDEPANTFGLSEKRWGGHISEVKVWRGGPQGELLWELKPMREVPVTGFKVTVGEVPEGFTQTVPLPPEKFTPVAGEVYWIGIDASFYPRAWPIEIKWKAE